MKSISLLLFLLIGFVSIHGQTYITNVTIADVLNQKLIPNQTVVYQNDIITSVKPSKKTKVPATATVIDGTGKYLIPGLTDAHVHFFQSGGLYTRPDAIDLRKFTPYDKELEWVHNNMEDFLKRYVKAGITTVIDVGASYSFLQQRDSFTTKSYAPAIYMTGPLFTTWEPPVYKGLKNDAPFELVTKVDDVKDILQRQISYHADFIKIWYIVDRDSVEASARKFEPIIRAIIDQSHQKNLKVAIHATELITAKIAVENGCDFLVHSVEDKLVTDEFIQLLKNKKTILCPTLIVADDYDKTFGQNMQYSSYELANANPQQVSSIFDLQHLPDTALINQYKKWATSSKRISSSQHEDSVRLINLKKLSDAGITIAAGTDAGNIGTQHASSFITELKEMQKSGMTNWQIVQSATINAAKILNKEKQTGSITSGKIADMILLNSNPIDNLENLTAISLVINKGHAINPDTLIKITPESLVQQQVNAYNLHNVDAFLEPYADDVELFYFPNKPDIKGKEIMKKDYSELFATYPGLHCEIKERIVQGDIIIDKERVTSTGMPVLEGVSIYHIINNKIAKVYFIQ